MKDVPKKDGHEVSGGNREVGTCIPPEAPPIGPTTPFPDDFAETDSQS